MKKEINYYKVLEKLAQLISCQAESRKERIKGLHPQFDANTIAFEKQVVEELEEEVQALVYAMNLIVGGGNKMTIKEIYEQAYNTDREDYKVVTYNDNSYGWYDVKDIDFDDENKEIIIFS